MTTINLSCKNTPQWLVFTLTFGVQYKMDSAARQVVRALHSMNRTHRLPWHRVINAKGQIALTEEESHNEQLLALQSEEVEVGLHWMIDLEKYQWHPESWTI